VRVLIIFELPMQASADDGAQWIRAEAGKLLAAPGVESLTVTELRRAARAFPHAWDWLIEIELGVGADVLSLAESDVFTDLMSELRSLRLHPITAVADPASAFSFSRADSR
jgi:hypothetical protein